MGLDAKAVYAVVTNLTGPIDPVGETHTDDRRMLNLIEFMAVVEKMVYAATEVAKQSKSHLGSIREAGEYARASLGNIIQHIEDELDESGIK